LAAAHRLTHRGQDPEAVVEAQAVDARQDRLGHVGRVEQRQGIKGRVLGRDQLHEQQVNALLENARGAQPRLVEGLDEAVVAKVAEDALSVVEPEEARLGGLGLRPRALRPDDQRPRLAAEQVDAAEQRSPEHRRP